MKPSLDYYLERRFPVEIRELTEADGGGWMAYIPALGKNLFRDDGETIEEALANLENLRVSLITEMYENGEEIPDPPNDWDAVESYSGVPGLRITKWLHKELAERARAEEVSLNQYLTSVLYQHISQVQTMEVVREYLRSWQSAEQPIYPLPDNAVRGYWQVPHGSSRPDVIEIAA